MIPRLGLRTTRANLPIATRTIIMVMRKTIRNILVVMTRAMVIWWAQQRRRMILV